MSLKKFKEEFEELARKHDRSIIFNDLLDYCIQTFTIKPAEKQYRDKYTEEEMGIFFNLLKEWVHIQGSVLEEKTYYDFWGEIYEEVVQSSAKASSMGQFYTPNSVVDLITKISLKDEEVLKNGGWVNDPACGSGRFLTSLYTHLENKDVYCLGQDLDEMSCKMAVLNFLIHGVQGGVAWMDTLEGTVYGAWKVNEFLYIDGTPTIMKVDSLSDCTCFLTDRKGFHQDDVKTVEHDSETGQTTLI